MFPRALLRQVATPSADLSVNSFGDLHKVATVWAGITQRPPVFWTRRDSPANPVLANVGDSITQEAGGADLDVTHAQEGQWKLGAPPTQISKRIRRGLHANQVPDRHPRGPGQALKFRLREASFPLWKFQGLHQLDDGKGIGPGNASQPGAEPLVRKRSRVDGQPAGGLPLLPY
ncbi:hypothetical protein DAETH_11750 [Deinococcus aetherius]|uniref:Uncharacterized protein n=1 Tax=Deinococcus aetherius TaxID=200252 RepID=A0ABN6RD33_9DEIO|nr:hypothetical protein DAETH_11750 [Deinococcus aetherius]